MSDERQRAMEHFVEEVGLFFEQNGLPRMAGRILGYLLIADPAQQTSDELAVALQASKGSISTMTRMLIQFGLIERVGVPGDRRDYFRLRPDAWTNMNRTKLDQLTLFRSLAERGLEVLGDAPPQQRARLEDMRDTFAWFERELPLLYARLEQERKR